MRVEGAGECSADAADHALDATSGAAVSVMSSLSENGCLQQIAAGRRTMTQDDDAILLQGFVLSIF
jgi:hypothetical protein